MCNDVTENCGIVGVVGGNLDAKDFLVEGLIILRNRGYDSAGIATMGPENRIAISKYASTGTTSDSIDHLKADLVKHVGNISGIGHTRWATHGGRTDENAHPHTDSKNRIALCHNGTIANSHELRKKLESQGVKFTSETDTEVIAALVGLFLDKGFDSKSALTQALQACDGSWGIAMINKDQPEEIIVACNGSPMVIGLGESKKYIASETSAFSKYTKNFISMKDGEIGVITASSTTLDNVKDRVQQASDEVIHLTPHPHPHFTIKECLEQPEAIARALSYGARLHGSKVVLGGLDQNIAKFQNVNSVLLTGCGTSKYASEFGAKLMRDLGCFDVAFVLDAAEIRRSDISVKNGCVIAVSQSGETKDVVRAVKEAQNKGVPVLSVVNQVGSHVARMTGLGVYLNAGREQAVASTKAFTSQITVLALIALWFRERKEEREGLMESGMKRDLITALQRLPISTGMALSLRSQCKEVAQRLLHKQHLFVLGKGLSEPIAMEGALKIKEICYLHAEGYSAGALKHGPLALIEGAREGEEKTPVICIIIDDEQGAQARISAEEVKARGGEVIVITDNPKLAEGLDDHPIVVPDNGVLTPLMAIYPLQLIAYELAVLKGVNPDHPRNLAKAVTTD
jgi:glucosamine--fructose-6-phosphate aminotransferase (isomerizing)